jgi:hypothetical protein
MIRKQAGMMLRIYPGWSGWMIEDTNGDVSATFG